MSKPVRLQLSRRKGFELQTLSREFNGLYAIKADRSTKLGNPFRVTKTKTTRGGKPENVWIVGSWNGPAMWIRDTKAEAIEISIAAYRAWIILDRNRLAVAAARGHNLACWCKPGEPCHADVLLELANR